MGNVISFAGRQIQILTHYVSSRGLWISNPNFDLPLWYLLSLNSTNVSPHGDTRQNKQEFIKEYIVMEQHISGQTYSQ